MSKIIGNTTATPIPRSDWEQTDKTKADFIRHKPELGTIASKNIDDFYAKVEIDEKLDEIKDAKADWSQNDSTALDYVKNRTHWVEKSFEILAPEQEVTGGYADLTGVENSELFAGISYIVTFDGISYECEMFVSSIGEYCLGDSRLMPVPSFDEETGDYLGDVPDESHPADVPFCIATYADSDLGSGSWYEPVWFWYMYCADEESHTVKVEAESDDSVYHPLDERYIPDTIARKADVSDINHIHNYYGVCTTGELVANKKVTINNFNLENGAVVIVKFENGNSVNNPTLNVSGTGAKPMYLYGTTPYNYAEKTHEIKAGAVQMFVYDGTGWVRDYWEGSEDTSALIAESTADWSQNDETALNYVKNRTHWTYDYPENITIFEDTYVTVNENEDYGLLGYTDYAPVVGETYVLHYNDGGEDITVECVAYLKDGDTSVYIRGEKENTTTTKIIYVKISQEDGRYRWGADNNSIIGWSGNKSFYLGIEKIENKTGYHTLNENFIPDTIARTTYVNDVCTALKNDLLNGAGDAYDTLKELGDLIDDNQNAIEALETVAVGKADANHKHNYYGVCTTAAGTAAKTVEIEGFELVTGAMVIVKFDNANSASNPTLNVSGTGAKPMYRYGTTAISTGTTTTGWYADSIQMFVYDGTGWIRDYWNNSTYSNAGLGQVYVTCSTAAETVAKTAASSSYALTTGGIVSVKFDNDVPAGATLNINSKGAKALYHRGATITDGVIKAGDIATFIYSTQYHLIAIDRFSNEPEAITNETIDAICGGAISYAEDVMF